ncbi:tripartite motif-containing protein 16-like [Erpetoichthys calabaricus]|uniref:tripartite motif-containing protein 16-like n=1 Tax=Erpetoichthys calabaricus TaxID=27687 RepID=UPI0022343B61|nr:tripartite motif-containing protein 16-like [Erpetoichthys calabaricus]
MQPLEPSVREEFLKYYCPLTLDPNTANRRLSLSEGNRKATLMADVQMYTEHAERFDHRPQVLCKEGLLGSRFYWEVEWSGGGAEIGVAYKEIDRKDWSKEGRLGFNDKSWIVLCSDTSSCAWPDKIKLLARPDPKIGIYLNCLFGTLSFYNISDPMTLLYCFKSTFTEPLYPGFRLHYNFSGDSDSSVTICQLSQSNHL